jgi:DNA-binding transcriptional LysR family regulator
LLRCEQAVQTVKAVASGQKGEIRVGFAPSLTVEILPKALRSFQEASPGVRVQLHDLSTQEMLRGLRENKLDVALMVRISPKVLAEFEFEEIRGYGVAVAMHPAHPLARVRKLTLEHLINERLIAYTLTDYPDYHALLADLFAGLPHPPKISEEHESSTSLIASIEAGRGIALVLDSFKCLVGPRVKIRNLTPAPKPLIVGVAHRKGTTSAAVQSFVKAAKCADTEK